MCLQAEVVVLGGAFFVNGNVNPAAEANIFGDPDAADIVFGSAHLYTLPLHAAHAACTQLSRCRCTGGPRTDTVNPNSKP